MTKNPILNINDHYRDRPISLMLTGLLMMAIVSLIGWGFLDGRTSMTFVSFLLTCQLVIVFALWFFVGCLLSKRSLTTIFIAASVAFVPAVLVGIVHFFALLQGADPHMSMWLFIFDGYGSIMLNFPSQALRFISQGTFPEVLSYLMPLLQIFLPLWLGIFLGGKLKQKI